MTPNFTENYKKTLPTILKNELNAASKIWWLMTRLMRKIITTYCPAVHVLRDFTSYPTSIKTKIIPQVVQSYLPSLTHPTEHISQFVDAHLNPLVPKLPSYIKDTTHFFRKLDDLKELPPGSLLVTLDVSSLYTNIPHKEGIEACKKPLNSSGHLSRSHLKTESICDLMRMILTMNSFEFDNNHFIQLHGTAMGTRTAPAYANLFMSDPESSCTVSTKNHTYGEGTLMTFLWFGLMEKTNSKILSTT